MNFDIENFRRTMTAFSKSEFAQSKIFRVIQEKRKQAKERLEMKINYGEMTFDELAELQADINEKVRMRAYHEGYKQGRLDEEVETLNIEEIPAIDFEPNSRFSFENISENKNVTITSKEGYDQLKRDEIVSQAKSDVEAFFADAKWHGSYGIKFVVNKEKRTTVALLINRHDGSVFRRGIAKCHQEDCFNVYIGMVISLMRALDHEVPEDYLNAPQPTEVRVGDKVGFKMSGLGSAVVGENLRTFQKAIANGTITVTDDSREELSE
jgi:hypothetical protein